MKTLTKFTISSLVALSFSSSLTHGENYTEEWDSLNKHNAAAEWFRDAKFGIYFHWGPYSVPAAANSTEWYPRKIYQPNSREQKFHTKHYGHPNESGYHALIPLFKAEKFQADEWAELFKKAGAQFAGPVAEHHDGYSMWDSEINPWNSVDTGPKRDITGELAKAIRNQGMKFITTFHHARNLQRYRTEEAISAENEKPEIRRRFQHSHFPPVPNSPTTSDDPKLQHLYGNLPEKQWLKNWNGKLNEVIDKYQPDIIWFDSWLNKIPEDNKKEFLAYYFNSAQKWNKNVVVVRKNQMLPDEVSIQDFEKGRLKNLVEKPWLTDDTVSKGSWSYTDKLKIKPAKQVLHVLIDIVSKNGQLLLNISPKADGSIPQNQRDTLLGMGAWLNKYGEAIYGTRPFISFGQGPTRLARGGHFTDKQGFLSYTPEDIRYTKKGNVIYAIQLGKAAPGASLMLSDFKNHDQKIESLTMLGCEEKIIWKQTQEGLKITSPNKSPDEIANVYKIQL